MRDIELEALLDEDILSGDHDVYYAGGGEGRQPAGSANALVRGFLGGFVLGILATITTQKLTGNQGGSRALREDYLKQFPKPVADRFVDIDRDIDRLNRDIDMVNKKSEYALAKIDIHLSKIRRSLESKK